MAINIQAFRLRTEIVVDNAKAGPSLRATERDVDKLGQRFTKLGTEVDKALKGKELGAKFGHSFSSSATSIITGSFDSLGQTLGSLIGTAIMPGIGTAIGSTVGGGVDAAMSKVSGSIMPLIKQGIDLNKEIERTVVEFTYFTGSEQEAVAYLNELRQMAVRTGKDFGFLVETVETVHDLTDNLELSKLILRAATDQAEDFGGRLETVADIANELGLIAERGIEPKQLKKLARKAIMVPEMLAESTGLSKAEIEKLIKADRIRGDVAARLIAETIERRKGGFAELIAQKTTYGAENRFNVLTQLRAAEGTENITKGIGDFYRSANKGLSSEAAKDFTSFIDQTSGSLIKLTESGLSTGINVTKGLADGIVSSDGFRAVGSAVTSVKDFTINALTSAFRIESPSKLSNETVGVPIGEGIALGIKDGFVTKFGQTKEEIVAELERLLQDPRVKAFFEAISRAEGGAPNIIVGGKRFSDMSRHPNVVGLRTEKGPSTAAGSFQITGTNWYGRKGRPGLKDQLGLPDFSAHSQELAALWLFAQQSGGAGLRALMSGDLNSAMAVAAKDWTSTPGSKIGGGRQLSTNKWMGLYNQALTSLTANGKPVTDASPMPVNVINWKVPDFNNAAKMFAQQQPAAPTPDLSNYVLQLGDEDAAIVDVIESKEQLIQVDRRSTAEMRQLINMSSLVPRALTPLIGAEKEHAETAIALTKEYQDAARRQLVVGQSFLSQLSGALGQVSGMMPQQQVGKKRSFFSKLLGFAAPFLSFIPGVGPILSQVAGIASAGLAGDYAGMTSGIATGLSAGGVFRSSGSGSGNLGGSLSGDLERRAIGGPARRGRMYWTGEEGPEPFIAPVDGRFLSHRDAMRAMSSRGRDRSDGYDSSAIAAAMERLAAAISRLEGINPHDVVRAGARGLIDAYDQDAGLIRLSGQRHRLA